MSIITDISLGKHDNELGLITSAAVARRKVIAKTKANTALTEIGVGEQVRLLAIRPKYMVGKIGRVVDKTNTKFVVEFLGELSRYGQGRVTVPASCVERVNQGAKNATGT